jgi:uncharacterized membrane protein
MKTFEEKLAGESVAWVSAGLITPTQRDALLQRHPAAERGGSRFIGIVSTIGGLLFAVGVSLVIKSNWGEISDWTKICGLVVLLVASYAVGWKLKMGGRHFVKTGEASLMVGQIFFLCGIALVSQIFHLNSRPATGVLTWWAGIALVPWLTRAKGAEFVSIVAGLVWIGMEMKTPGSLIHVIGYKSATIGAVYFLLGVALWFSGIALRESRWSDLSGTHEKWGLIVAGMSLFTLGFVRHDWNYRSSQFAAPDANALFALLLAAALALVAMAFVWRRGRAECAALAGWIAAAMVPVCGVIFLGPLGDEGWLWSVLAWVALFALSIAIVRVGLQTGREGWVNLGILFIAANIIARYFDLFGTLLEGGVFFIVTGVLVAGLGIYLERKRRALVSALRQEALA